MCAIRKIRVLIDVSCRSAEIFSIADRACLLVCAVGWIPKHHFVPNSSVFESTYSSSNVSDAVGTLELILNSSLGPYPGKW